jgi:hypothetical protein
MKFSDTTFWQLPLDRLTLDPMGKYSNAFFSETTNMIKAKLYLLRFLFRYEIQNGGYGRT